MIPDRALEANRRAAWARFYAARAELEELRLVAAELAEWAVVARDRAQPLPPALASVVDLARELVAPNDLEMVRRFVRFHQDAA